MNNSNNAIAVIGAKEIVRAFQAIGYDCFYETEPNALIRRCNELGEQGYRIILIMETAAQQINAYLNERANSAYPIILPIPDTIAREHYGLQRVKQNMEKAMGIKVGGNL